MIEFIIGTLLYAKHKKLNIKPIFYSWEIYLPLFCAVFYIFLEVTVWARWYFFIPYSNIIKIATLLSYIPATRFDFGNGEPTKYLSLLKSQVGQYIGEWEK